MKVILQSIKPQYCELIAAGKKTIEVRKTKPKIKTPFKVYIYCTVNGTTAKERDRNIFTDLRGKVIGEYVCDEIIELNFDELEQCYMFNNCYCGYRLDEILSGACLSENELQQYGKGKTLYGYHISNLVIYDKPKELSEFKKANRKECFYSDLGLAIPKCEKCNYCNLTHPPQSWCYVEEI